MHALREREREGDLPFVRLLTLHVAHCIERERAKASELKEGKMRRTKED